ncbi:MAG: HPr family phosphocarrier protein [Candidatus Omnitrophota bacterium]
MTKIRKEVVVKNKLGLHARPAALFVQTANKFDSNIAVEKDNQRVNGKSIMGILTLGAEQGSRIIIEAEGSDAESAILELEGLVEENESNSKT